MANPQVLEQGRCREGFKPDVATGSVENRNATTSACVGWDKPNIENWRLPRKLLQALKSSSCENQNGLTITRMTMPIIKTVGTSLIIR
jgi:hypothetical protein